MVDYTVIGNSPVNYLYIPERLREVENKKYHQEDTFKVLPNTTFYIVSNYLKKNSVVLDVGCSSGYFGKFLIDTLGAKVYGVDIDEKGLSIAKERGYSDVYKIDLDNDIETFGSVLDDVKPDYILCLDVVEHLKTASFFMKKLLRFLKKNDSELIVSIPNIGHIDIIYNLLMGRFNYSLLGILDNTHLRFFTRSSFKEWIKLIAEDVGLELDVCLIGKTEAPFCLNEKERNFNKDISRLQHMAKRVNNNDLFTVQFVFSIKKRV
ncbi:class I SAM-dependent methyltransferase [Desulfurobacterium sp.]